MKALTTVVARIVFAVPFFVFGLNHFMNTAMVSSIVPGFLPVKTFWVYLTGVALIAASLSIIVQYKARLASILLAVMLLSFVVLIHIPGMAQGMQSAFSGLLKDTALAGGALAIAGISKK